MTAHQYFDNDYDNINENSVDEIRNEIRNEIIKEAYNGFMTNLEAVYSVVSTLPKDIQLDVFMNMMRDI